MLDTQPKRTGFEPHVRHLPESPFNEKRLTLTNVLIVVVSVSIKESYPLHDRVRGEVVLGWGIYNPVGGE